MPTATFMVDFTKTFKTMSQDRRAAWLRDAALAASAAEPVETAAHYAADTAKQKSSAEWTALRSATDVAGIAFGAAPQEDGDCPHPVGNVGRRHQGAADLITAGAPLGLVAGGAVAFAIRHRRRPPGPRNAEKVQVRRERQAT